MRPMPALATWLERLGWHRPGGFAVAVLDRGRRCRWHSAGFRGARRGASFTALFAPLLSSALREAGLRQLRHRCEAAAPGDGSMAGLAVAFLPLPGGWRLAVLAGCASALPLEDAPIALWQITAAGRTAWASGRCRALLGGVVPTRLRDASLRLALPAGGEGPLGLDPGVPAEAWLDRAGAAPLPLLLVAAAAPGGWLLSLLDTSALRTPAGPPGAAPTDPLTGLADRAALGDALEAMIMGAEGGALIHLDLDHLRGVNGQRGRAAGDALLREAARRLRDAVRPCDMVARVGGDEFAVLARGMAAMDAGVMGERLREALHFRLAWEGGEIAASASVGVAVSPADGTDGAALRRAAELAMREAKAHGSGLLRLFEPALLRRVERRALLRDALPRALAAGELELHVQPQIHLPTGRLDGAEALVRWRVPALGCWVPPGEILATAGELGLLRELDLWVLRAAVRLQRSWARHPAAPGRLGVNISSATLHSPDFAEEVRAALDVEALSPTALEIEIPEDLAVRDLSAVARTMSAIRAIGVPLALDDFGAGHSNLTHVMNLPVQRLKLDRSNVSLLPDDPKAYAILRTTMTMARGMGIEVIAEGVETEAQAEALARLGCHVVQGWLIAKAMPPAMFLREMAGTGLHRAAV